MIRNQLLWRWRRRPGDAMRLWGPLFLAAPAGAATTATSQLTLTLPTGDVSLTASETVTLPSASDSATATLTETFTLPTSTATLTSTSTVTLPPATDTATLTLPTSSDTWTPTALKTSTQGATTTATATGTATADATATSSGTVTLGTASYSDTPTPEQSSSYTQTLPTFSVTVSATATLPDATASVTATVTLLTTSATVSATVTVPSATDSGSVTGSPTVEATVTATVTTTASETATATAEATVSSTASATASGSATLSATGTTASETFTSTAERTVTATETGTTTAERTVTATETDSLTSSRTPTPELTASATLPSATASSTASASLPTDSASESVSLTLPPLTRTATATGTPSPTPTPSRSRTPRVSPTPTATATPTVPLPPTPTPTPLPPTLTRTPSPTRTVTPSAPVSPTATPPPVPTATPTVPRPTETPPVPSPPPPQPPPMPPPAPPPPQPPRPPPRPPPPTETLPEPDRLDGGAAVVGGRLRISVRTSAQPPTLGSVLVGLPDPPGAAEVSLGPRACTPVAPPPQAAPPPAPPAAWLSCPALLPGAGRSAAADLFWEPAPDPALLTDVQLVVTAPGHAAHTFRPDGAPPVTATRTPLRPPEAGRVSAGPQELAQAEAAAGTAKVTITLEGSDFALGAPLILGRPGDAQATVWVTTNLPGHLNLSSVLSLRMTDERTIVATVGPLQAPAYPSGPLHFALSFQPQVMADGISPRGEAAFEVPPGQDPQRATKATAAVNSVAASAAGNPLGATNGARTSIIFALVNCPPEEDRDELSWAKNPLGLTLPASKYPESAGSLVGNVIIVAATLILHIVLAFLLRLCRSQYKNYDHKEANWFEAMAVARFPSFSFIPVLLLFSPLVEEGLKILFYGPSPWEKLLAAVSLFCLCPLLPLSIARLLRSPLGDRLAPNAGPFPCKTVEFPHKQPWSYMLGDFLWTSRIDRTFHRRYALVYKDFTVKYRSWLLVDLGLNTLLAFIKAPRPSSHVGCQIQTVLCFLGVCAYAVAVVRCRPFIADLDNHFTACAAFLQAGAVCLAFVSILREEPQGNFTAGAGLCLVVASALVLVMAVLDLLTWFKERWDTNLRKRILKATAPLDGDDSLHRAGTVTLMQTDHSPSSGGRRSPTEPVLGRTPAYTSLLLPAGTPPSSELSPSQVRTPRRGGSARRDRLHRAPRRHHRKEPRSAPSVSATMGAHQESIDDGELSASDLDTPRRISSSRSPVAAGKRGRLRRAATLLAAAPGDSPDSPSGESGRGGGSAEESGESSRRRKSSPTPAPPIPLAPPGGQGRMRGAGRGGPAHPLQAAPLPLTSTPTGRGQRSLTRRQSTRQPPVRRPSELLRRATAGAAAAADAAGPGSADDATGGTGHA